MDFYIPKKSRCIVILGMHRSGTSALAGTMQEAGLYLGQVLENRYTYNPTGLQEAESILYMHEDLLKENNGSWHEPPEVVEWKPLHRSVRDLFIESRSNQKIWGFKDPRTLLTINGWLEAMPHLEAVGIFREPSDTAYSLNKRNGFGFEKCFDVWLRYNKILLNLHQKFDFPIIEFVPEADKMRASFQKAIKYMNMPISCNPEFFNSVYYRSGGAHIEAPMKARHLIMDLRACAL